MTGVAMQKISSGKFCIHFFMGLLPMLAIIGGFIFLMDPFYHYHTPILGTKAYLYNQVYQTPGAASHFEYDSAIVGTSMTENFRISWFEEIGLNAMKFSYSGARCADIRSVLDKVYESGNEIQFIMMDINDYQLSSKPEERYVDLPEYLYDDVWWTDTQYLFNGDAFWMAAGRALEAVTGNQPDLDDAYTWEDPTLFSEEIIKINYRYDIQCLQELMEKGETEEYNEERYSLWEENLNHIIPVIEAHPETQFVIFYPPYSVVYWEQELLLGRLEATLDMYAASAKRLLQMENVKVFVFFGEKEIISDLNNYRDYCHYSPKINRYIFDCIRDGKNEMTEEKIDSYFEELGDFIRQYPYEKIWED